MHELSIANNLVEIATEFASEAKAKRISKLNVTIGELSCVSPESLRFCFEAVVKGTLLEGAELNIQTRTVEIFCDTCEAKVALTGIQSLRCPNCNHLSANIVSGKELELVSLEVDDSELHEETNNDELKDEKAANS